MDYSSFGRKDGQFDFNDEEMLRKMYENPRKRSHYIDTTQQPEDTDQGILRDLVKMLGGYSIIPFGAGIVLILVHLTIHPLF